MKLNKLYLKSLLKNKEFQRRLHEIFETENDEPKNVLNENVVNMMYLMDYDRASTNFESESNRSLLESKVTITEEKELLNEIAPIVAWGIGALVTAIIGGELANQAVRSTGGDVAKLPNNEFLTGSPWETFYETQTEALKTLGIGEEKLFNPVDGVTVISQQDAQTIANNLWTIMTGPEFSIGGFGSAQRNQAQAVIDIIKNLPTLLDVSRVAFEYGTKMGAGSVHKNLGEWIDKELYAGQVNDLKDKLSKKPYIIYKGEEFTKTEWSEKNKEVKEAFEKMVVPPDLAKKFTDNGYECVVTTALENSWERTDKPEEIRISIEGPQGGEAVFNPDGKFAYRGPIWSAGEETLAGEYGCEGSLYKGDLTISDEESTTPDATSSSEELTISESYKNRIISEQNYPFGNIILDTNPAAAVSDPDKIKSKDECTLSDIRKGVKECYLEEGDEGYVVSRVQELLAFAGMDLDEYGISGVFTIETKKAVQEFQKKVGLLSSGKVDQKTLEKLEEFTADERSFVDEDELIGVETAPETSADEFASVDEGQKLEVVDRGDESYITTPNGQTIVTADQVNKIKYDNQGNFKTIKTQDHIIKFDKETGLVTKVRNRRRFGDMFRRNA